MAFNTQNTYSSGYISVLKQSYLQEQAGCEMGASVFLNDQAVCVGMSHRVPHIECITIVCSFYLPKWSLLPLSTSPRVFHKRQESGVTPRRTQGGTDFFFVVTFRHTSTTHMHTHMHTCAHTCTHTAMSVEEPPKEHLLRLGLLWSPSSLGGQYFCRGTDGNRTVSSSSLTWWNVFILKYLWCANWSASLLVGDFLWTVSVVFRADVTV